MKRLAYFLTAVLIVPNQASAKFIQADYYDSLVEMNRATVVCVKSQAVLRAQNIA